MKEFLLNKLNSEFSQAANLVVAAYEEKNYAKVQEIFQFTLSHSSKSKEELEKAFHDLDVFFHVSPFLIFTLYCINDLHFS